MHEHIEPISQAPQTTDSQTSHPAILGWLNRIMGAIGMFIACLFVCHAAGMISIDLGHFSP
ncbi:MAG: hypothetical protein KME17_29005 [Cyanosarcina radialis HA8281-LM2]|jgi:hypothetical protein|nr:hypothetical protein [Cyanosarcina radialis HA8281-LM2]